MSTALVLGGGGPVGMAWEFGLLSGVAKSGVDLEYIDLTIGTSAGSAVGAWFRSGSVSDADVIGRLEALGGELLELITKLTAVAPQTSGSQTALPTALMDAMNAVAQAGTDPAASNRTIGQLALDAPTIPETAYVSLFEHLVGTHWPSALVCASTDVDSGELQTWDHRSGVSLAQAVAASCAWPGAFPTVTVAGRRYMDGGVQDGLNPQLAAGHDTVLGISCRSLASEDGMTAGGARRQRNTQDALGDLKSQGSHVVLVEPDSRFLAISEHGAALMDLSRVRAANAAGVELGAEVAERFARGQAD